MVKTLVITSHDKPQDIKASQLITKEMVSGQSERIIWMSSFGKQVNEYLAEVHDLAQDFKDIEKWYKDHARGEAEIRKLFASLQVALDGLDKRISSLEEKLKKAKKKEKEYE